MCNKDSLISSELSCKSTWKPGTLIYPLPAALISCGNGNEINIMTVSWLGTICTNPPMCYISVRPERHSYDLIKKNGCFVINLTNEEMAFATDWCGVKSGKDINKFKEMNLTPLKAQVVDAPIIKESPLSIECEVVEIKELGSHHMFIANVVNILADEKYIDKSITMEDLQNIDNNIKEGKLITIDEFKQYELKDEELENGQTKYIYNMNDKYQVEVIERNQRIVSIVLKNKVTYTSVDIIYSSLTRFLETE